MQKKITVLLAVVLITLFVTPGSARAQVGWTHTFDFTRNTLFTWEPVSYMGSDLANPSTSGVYGACPDGSVHAQMTLDTTVPITNVSIDLWYEQDANHPVQIHWTLLGVEVGGGSYNASGTTGDVTFNFSGGSGYDRLLVMADQTGCTGDYFIKEITFTGTSETGEDPFAVPPYKPLREDVTYEVNHVTGFGPVVDDVHTELNANVYNAQDGQVVALTASGSGYMVKVKAADDSYTLYDNLSAVYPSLNDNIDAGCILGTAGEAFKKPSQTYTQNPGLLWFFPGTDFIHAETNEYIDWQTLWDEPPLGGVPCGTKLRTDNCLNYNPGLDDEARGWTLFHVDPLDVDLSSVQLKEFGSTIAQYIVLDHEVDYYITLQTRIYHAYDFYTVIVMKGTDSSVIDTQSATIDMVDLGKKNGDPVITQIGPLDLSDYDVNDTYLITVSASNEHTAGIHVDDVCVHDGTATVSVAPCYFDNHEFNDDDGADWDSSETGVTWRNSPADFDSDVVLEPGGWISQAVSLASYEADDAIYDLDVKSRVIGDIDPETITDIFTAGFDADLNITVETDVGDYGSLHIDNLLVTLSHVKSITVAETTTLVGDLTIENDSESAHDVAISSVCLSPRAGYWPGEEPDITQEPGEVCQSCAVPTALGVLSVYTWFAWLWCNINNFIWCTLAVWMVTIMGWLNSVRDYLGLLGRYLAVLSAYLSLWLLDSLGTFGGNLLDVAMAALATAWNAIAGLDLLTLFYDIMGYIAALLFRLFNIGRVGVGSALNLFDALVYLSHLSGLFAAGILTSLSGDPTVIALPSCSGTLAGIPDGYCFVVLTTNGIIEEFPAITLGWVLDTSICVAFTAMWTLDRLGDAFKDI